jgi:hypothetical protein
VPGTHYQVNVQSQEFDAATNTTYGASRAETFCFQCGSGTDTVAPSVPTGVSAALGTNNVPNIAWTASTDNVGVTYYKVYRNGAVAGTPQGTNNTAWQDIQAAASTAYTYTVAACDAANNCSAQSTGASVTTGVGTGSSSFDGSYTGTWTKSCPTCGVSASAGTFSGTLTNGVFSNIQFILGSGDSGMLFDSGTVSASGSITGSGVTPSQCSSSPSTFTGQVSNSGGMTISYSRPASGTCQAETGTITASRSGGGGGGTPVTVVSGWNLLGNSNTAAINVATTFGDPIKVNTVWKWVSATSTWAFYTPSKSAADLATYAAGKGYDVLTTIAGGEGFWVNAASAFTGNLPAGTAVSAGSFATTLGSGWSLISIGEIKTPRTFNNGLSSSPPSLPIVAASVLTSLWAWDSGKSSWYFYAPSYDNTQGALLGYTLGKGYLDFDTTGTTLAPGMGFWVNMP